MRILAIALLAAISATPVLAGGDTIVVPEEEKVIKFEEPTLMPVPGFEPTEQYNTTPATGTLPGDFWFYYQGLYAIGADNNIVHPAPATQR